MFNGSSGEEWDESGTWAGFTPVGEWQGVETNSDGRVVKATISGPYQQTPRISMPLEALAELGNLTELQVLTISRFTLDQGIPPEIGNLANLTNLTITSSQTTGGIPPEIYKLAKLKELDLSSNGVTGEIPPELAGITDLERLYLDDNQLTGGIPPELAGMRSLVFISLAGNQLTGGIPPELGALNNLYSLNLSGNQLTGQIPPELGALANLSILDLSNNNLTGTLPEELGNLEPKIEIYLQENNLNGEIPLAVDSMMSRSGATGENEADLTGNNFSGCMSAWFHSSKRRKTDLPICETTPNQGDAEALVAIYTTWMNPGWNNWLSRSPLHEWWYVTTDKEGRVARIRITGDSAFGYLNETRWPNGRPIPKELGDLSALQELYIPNQELGGEIPASLGNLSKLRLLDLQRNNLTGDLPASFLGLRELRRLVLEDNKMTFEVPGTLLQMAELPHLDALDADQGNRPTQCVDNDAVAIRDFQLDRCR